jgi:predicted metalloprotease with PDZ domain
MSKPSYSVVIDLTEPETHRALVTISAAEEELPPLLQFPVWTPGSYLVREYARHVTLLEPAEKEAKNRWRLKGKPRKVTYEVYCFERTVRTSFLDENYAVLVGATLLPLLHSPFEVEIRLPRSWKMLSSALPFRKAGPGRWKAAVTDDDQWIDSPLIACAPGFGELSSFRCKGITHHIAWVGPECARPMAELKKAFEKISATTIRMMGGAPFREYWFLLHFGQKLYGGLEHRDSQLSQFDGAALAENKSWDGFLRLVAHEYFHAWNVKSLRPIALGPFDYFQENYTPDIWFSEGLTDYFDDMIPLEAGLIDQAAYAKARLRDVELFPDGHPGHKRRSLAESSFDAWIRYYRQDEDSVNTDVSYYSKGAALGWCWDAYLQKRSKGRWTLLKLMGAFWKEFGVDAGLPLRSARPGFTREELLRFSEAKTGISQRATVESWVTGRAPLPWRDAARFFDIKWKENITDPSLHFLGLQVQWKGHGTVAKVLSGSAAESAGIAPHDELLAINGVRITDNEKLQLALKAAMKQGKSIDLILGRLDRVILRSVEWRPHNGIGVEIAPAPAAANKKKRK